MLVPEHLLVLGGGYIGLEFGQMFRRFGSRVTIVQRGERLLGREDADVADAVAEILREDGVEVLLKTSALRVALGADGAIELTVGTPDGERTLSGSHLLVAVGRTPNSTRSTWGRPASRPTSMALSRPTSGGRPTCRHLCGGRRQGRASLHPHLLRRLPHPAHQPAAGRRRDDRRQAAGLHRLYRPAAGPGGPGRGRGERGRAQHPRSQDAHEQRRPRAGGRRDTWLYEGDRGADSGQILGGAVLGIEGGEMAAQLQLAIMGKRHYRVLRDAIFSHPTLSEAWNNLFTTLDEGEGRGGLEAGAARLPSPPPAKCGECRGLSAQPCARLRSGSAGSAAATRRVVPQSWQIGLGCSPKWPLPHSTQGLTISRSW